MKTETFYAAFACEFTDLMHGAPVHEGKDGMVIAIRDNYQAYELYEKLQQVPGAQLSVYGCGPDLDQHVYLPSCAGIAKLEIPESVIEGDKQAVDLRAHPEYITSVTIRVSGDVSHSIMDWSQLTLGAGVDYEVLQRQVMTRFDDLCRIASKFAETPDDIRRDVDLDDEFARDSLRALYNSNGILHHRFRLVPNPSPEQTAMHFGMEYLQTYMKACEQNLKLDFNMRSAHDWQDSFNDMFAAAYSPDADYRVLVADVVHTMMSNMAQSTTDIETRAVLSLLMQQAERDSTTYSEQPVGETPDIVPEEPEEVL